MEDDKIIALFNLRDERAIAEFDSAHKKPCLTAALSITGDMSDAEECYNDTCLARWRTIPPQNPASLRAYGLKICKNFALNLVKAKSRQKRCAVLVELNECTTAGIDGMDEDEIGRAIDSFMETLERREAVIFMRRYYCSEPVKDIARSLGMKENQISKILSRLRKKLKKHLELEGIGL